MSECILTQDVAYCDAIELKPSECPICCEITIQKAGWYGVLCTGCKHEWDEEDWRGSISQKRREHLRLSRRQMGVLVGVAGNKIAKYERRKCPDAYWEKTKELIKQMEVNNDKK